MVSPAPVDVVRLADHPELVGPFWALSDLWPAFMQEDPVADLYFSRLSAYPEHVLVAVDDDGQVVARALGVPFAMGEEHGRPDLPASGWDGVIRWAWLDSLVGRRPTHLSALEITVAARGRGTGVAGHLLEALRTTARAADLVGYVAPVRPSRKHHEPRVPMGDYVARRREDGLPQDPWLRLHVRAGGRVVGVCPTSMTIPGTLAQWRAWSGLPLDADGPVELAGGLAPLHVDVGQDHAVYVEPNVWVAHSW